MELDDELIFFFCEISTLEVRAKVVYPPQPTALAAPKQPYRHELDTKISTNSIHLSKSKSWVIIKYI